MKKRITLDQLNELDDRQREKLADMLRELLKTNDFVETQPLQILDDYILPPDIGDMIEILDNSGNVNHHFIETYSDSWLVNGKKQSNLCDALWEVVKEVLR